MAVNTIASVAFDKSYWSKFDMLETATDMADMIDGEIDSIVEEDENWDVVIYSGFPVEKAKIELMDYADDLDSVEITVESGV